MTKGNKSEIVPIRLTPELKKALQYMADKDSRSLSDFIRVQLSKIAEPFKGKK
jgi:hypothetical protein